MVSMTLAVPEDLKKQMDQFKEMNWSEVARQAIREKVNDLLFLQRMKSQSTLTDEEALRLGDEVKRSIAKKNLKERKGKMDGTDN